MKRKQITEDDAKKMIESLLVLQEAGNVFPCPRCGHDKMHAVAARNALSRRASIYVCPECGTDEAMLDMVKAPAMPFSQWGMVLGLTSSRAG